MNFSFTEDQQNIRDTVLKHCSRFTDDFWLARDQEGIFPHDFHRSMAEAGWLGIAMPEKFGGSGLGITEAAIMMQAVAESGGGMTAASSIHGPVFTMKPVELFGTEEQKQRMIPPVINGQELICFAVTEPNTGLDTTKLKTRAEKRDGGYLVNGEKIWISVAKVAKKVMLLARTTPLEEVKRKTDGFRAEQYPLRVEPVQNDFEPITFPADAIFLGNPEIRDKHHIGIHCMATHLVDGANLHFGWIDVGEKQ